MTTQDERDAEAARTHNNANCGDVLVHSFWRCQTPCIIDLRMTNTECRSYRSQDPEKPQESWRGEEGQTPWGLPRTKTALHPPCLFCGWNGRIRDKEGSRKMPCRTPCFQMEGRVQQDGRICSSVHGNCPYQHPPYTRHKRAANEHSPCLHFGRCCHDGMADMEWMVAAMATTSYSSRASSIKWALAEMLSAK